MDALQGITLLGHLLYELFVFQLVGMNELEKRIAEQERILAVVKAPLEFVQVGV